MMKRRVFIVCGASIICGGAGVALANGNNDAVLTPHSPPAVKLAARPLDSAVADRFSVFRNGPASGTVTEVPAGSTLAGVARSVADPDSSRMLQSLDIARAVEVPIADSTVSAWIAPTAGGVCSIVQDPVDGSGVGCNTLAKLDKGLGLTVMGDKDRGHAIVIAPVPDGGSTISLATESGTVRLPAKNNAAAADLPATGFVSIGDGPDFNLAVIVKP